MLTRPILVACAAVAVGVAATAVSATTSTGAPAGATAPADGPVFINEIHYDNDGTDADEAIEVAGPAGTDLSEWSIVLYNGAPGTGTMYDSTELSAVLSDQTGGYGTTAVTYPSNGIQNGAPDGVALVDADGNVAQFLSYEGSFTATDGPAAGTGSTDIAVDEGPATPSGSSLGLHGTGLTYGDFGWTGLASSFGAPNPLQTFDDPIPDPSHPTTEPSVPPTDPPPTYPSVPPTDPPTGGCLAPPAVTPISAVQGSGGTNTCDGQEVTIEGVVVGDYEGAAPALQGFYVQQADGTHDDDPATSEGLFVFNGSNDSVSLGDTVQVTGAVGEYFDQTQVTASDVAVTGSSATVTVTDVSLPAASADAFEPVESMLVQFAQPLTVTELYQLGRFGQVTVSGERRLDQPTQVAEPGDEANAVQAANDLNRIVIDDALNNQNPDPIVLGRGGQPLTASNTLRGGDTVTGAVGVMTYTWAGNSASPNAWRLRVQGDLSDDGSVPGGAIPNFEPANARPTAAPDVGGSLRVSNFNVLNYFLTLAADGAQCGPAGFEQECRGAESTEEFERQRTKLLEALTKLDADIVGLAELENTDGVEPLADIVAGLNEKAGSDVWSYVDTGTIGTDVIKVGVIYRTDAVTPIGEPAILDSSVDPGFDDDNNRPSLAASFEQTGTGEVMTIVVNHLKSKGSCPESGEDADQGDGASCWNATRTAAAQALVSWLGSDPTGVGDTDYQITGDLNSYAKEDPIDVLVDAGYVDLGAQHDGYSYVFDGQWGTLDYSLSSPSLAEQVAGAAEYHINSDEPTALDYNTNFKSPNQVDELYAPDEFRTADHDPLVVGFDLGGGAAYHAKAKPMLLWPANHRYKRVTATTSDGEPVAVVGVTSSEADISDVDGDEANDFVIEDDGSVKLRAERIDKCGRLYTLRTQRVVDGQTAFANAYVAVPPALRDWWDCLHQQ